MQWKKHISASPEILCGKPVIKNTRIAVDLIIEKLKNGETIDDVLESYPHLSHEKIMACLSYASEDLGNGTNLSTGS